ncbi:MAG: FG-GAP-like repeat-containing protein [Bacteroidota bacterium]
MTQLPVMGQTVKLSSTLDYEITTCGDAGDFDFQVINDTSVTLKPLSFQIDLPTGMKYVASSVAAIEGGPFTEMDISDLNNIILGTDSLAVGDTLSFRISYTANCNTVTFQQAGNLLENETTVFYNGTSQKETSSSFNLLTAALSITGVTPTSYSGLAGSSFTRQITMFNGGTGALNEFKLAKIHDSNIAVSASDIGILNATGDTITFDSTAIKTIGDGDIYFEPGESLTVTETVDILGCNNVNTVFDAFWGCDDNLYCQSSTSSSSSNSNTVITTEDPAILRTLTSGYDNCIGSSNYDNQIRFVNSGSGPAVNTNVTIQKTSASSYSEILSTGLTYKVGLSGSPISLSLTGSSSSSSYSCLSSTPLSSISFSLPNLQPGDTVYIDFQTYTCCIDVCTNASFNGWSVSTSYDNACGTKSYSHSDVGETEYNRYFTLYTESPAVISDGNSDQWLYRLSSATFNLPDQAGALYDIEFSLPTGLNFSGNSSDLVFRSGLTEWSPKSVNYDSTNRSILAQYEFPIPANFDFLLAEAELTLSLDCDAAGVTSGYQATSAQMFYQLDSTCTSGCRIPMTCEESTSTYFFCPGSGCSDGLSLWEASLSRTNFGSPDNNGDGLADGSGSLNMNQVQSRRLMFGDTLNVSLNGEVSNSGFNFAYGYASSKIPMGTNFTALGGSVTVYDASSGSYYSCSNLSVSKTNGTSDSATFVLDFSASSLNSAGCSDFNGYVYGEGDSIWVDMDLALSTNVGAQIEEVTTINRMYLSVSANPSTANQYNCNWIPVNITLIGYAFSVSGAEDRTVRNCTQSVSQSYYLTIGPCCTNYEGGNLFPYEYRNWANIASAKVWIPSGYDFVSASFSQNRTTTTGGSATESYSGITYDSSSGDTLVFDLSQYLAGNGGSVYEGDDGFSGTLTINLDPVCTKTQSTYEEVGWLFALDQSDNLGGETTGWLSGANDRIRYAPAELEISTSNPIVDGLNQEVTFDLTIENNSGGKTANSVWFTAQSPSGKVIIDSVYTSAGPITESGGLYQIGTLSGGGSQDFSIDVSTSDCNTDSIRIYYGFGCDGFPASLAANGCPIDSEFVYVEPKDAELQITYTPQGEVDVCNPEFTFDMRIASVLYAYSKDIVVDIVVPAGIQIASGTSYIRYPITDSYTSISDPELSGSTYTFNLDSLNSTIASDGLPGATNFSYSRVDLRFDFELDENFTQGDRFEIYLNGNEYCGDPIAQDYVAHPKIYVESPLSSVFFQDTSSVFQNDLTDSRSLSWADVDNDGDQDIFVANYDLVTANSLYLNNGNGTFTQSTSSDLVQDIGPTTSASFADIDNDGDLDAFVTNDIGTGNWLYENDGSGNFTIISATSNGQIAYKGYSFSCSWADYDLDGYLDLFICDYQPTKYNLLYHNNGDKTFTRVSGGDISAAAFSSTHSSWADYDEDGDPDLFVSNDQNTPNLLYRNDGNGIFTSVLESTFADSSYSSGSSWGDYDNDGDFDLFVANNADSYNFLYRNNGNATFTRIFSGDIALDKGNSQGSGWTDYNNDGYLDLFVSNDRAGFKFLYQNNGDGTFTRVSNELTTALGNTMATAWGDYDNDGDMDVFSATYGNEANVLFKNSKGKCNSFAKICLNANSSNGLGIGSVVKAKANINGVDVWQTRLIGAGGGGAYGQGDLRTIFGFGDATVMDSLIIQWPSGLRQYDTNISLNDPSCLSYVEPCENVIYGTVYHDENGNCIMDGGEAGIPNIQILIGDDNRSITTDSAGNFEMKVEDGTFSVEAQATSIWTNACTASYDITVSGCSNDSTSTFGFTSGCSFPDLEVVMGSTPLRKGFTATYAISYENQGGNEATNTQLKVYLDEHMDPASASPVWTSYDTTNSILIWDLGTLSLGETGTIYFEDSILTTSTIGDSLSLSVAMSANESDCDNSNDSISLRQEVVGAIDPNDILVYPNDWVNLGEQITYRIRFQNVGNFPATYVTIIDTLPENLDLESFEMEVASHEYQLELNGNIATWRFLNIDLPDSVSNEAESHGFVQFHIRPKVNVKQGEKITNRAAIIFDFNEAVITNTALIRVDIPNRFVVSDGLSIYPNPAKHRMSFYLEANAAFGSQRIIGYSITSTLGNELVKQWIKPTRVHEIEVDKLEPGIYYLRVFDLNRRTYVQKFMVSGK